MRLEEAKHLNWWRRWQQAQEPFWQQPKPELPDDPKIMPQEVAAHTYHEMSSSTGLHMQPRVHENFEQLIVHEMPAAEISTELL